MRYISTPAFSKKVQSLALEAQARVSAALRRVQAASKDELLNLKVMTLLQSDVYVLRAGEFRIFGTVAGDSEGEVFVLLDLAQYNRGPFRTVEPNATRNPRVNSTLNPRVNSALNPRVNSAVNPKVNSSINPRVNSALNPRVNSALNPRVNSTVNFRVNSWINPRINSSLNPRINTVLNPRLNQAFDGPFVYDVDLNLRGFLVRANDQVVLSFNEDADFVGVGVKNSLEGYSMFDTDNEWIGQMVNVGEGRYLTFDINNEWTGFVV